MNPNEQVFQQPQPTQHQIQPQYATRPAKRVVELNSKDSVFFILFIVASFLFSRLGVFTEFNFGFSVFSVIITVLAYIHIYRMEKKHSQFGKVSFALALILEISFFFNNNFTVKIFDCIAVLFLAVSFVGYETNAIKRNDGGYSAFLEPVKNAFNKTFDDMGLPFRSARQSQKDGKSSSVFGVAIGLMIALPLLAVVIALFMSSDVAFSTLMTKLFKDIALLVASLLLAVFFFGFFYSFVFASNKSVSVSAEEKNGRYGNASSVTVNTILTVLSVVYLFYLFSQLAYVSKAFSFMLPENFSAAEFARSGFFEMFAIAAINLLLFGVCSIVVRRKENGSLKAATKSLLVFICAFTEFYIVTAFIKMWQYISRFGLTELRVFTSVFMLALALSFLVLLARLFASKIHYGKAIIVIFSVSLIALSYCDVGSVISSYNYERYLKSGKSINLDVEQLGRLQFSSVETLTRLATDEPESDYKKSAEYYIVSSLAGLFSAVDYSVDKISPNESLDIYNFFGLNLVKINARRAVLVYLENNPYLNAAEVKDSYRGDYDGYDTEFIYGNRVTSVVEGGSDDGKGFFDYGVYVFADGISADEFLLSKNFTKIDDKNVDHYTELVSVIKERAKEYVDVDYVFPKLSENSVTIGDYIHTYGVYSNPSEAIRSDNGLDAVFYDSETGYIYKFGVYMY